MDDQNPKQSSDQSGAGRTRQDRQSTARTQTPPQHTRRRASDPRASERRKDEAIVERIKALPGTLTYLDLMAKNRRDSTLLIIAMLALAGLLGGLLGAVVVVYAGGSFNWTGLGIGVVLAVIVGGIVTLWSWYNGSKTILGMTHAHEVNPKLDPELYNIVDEMRLAAGMPMPKVYVVGDSALNAFATGRGPKQGVVAVTSGLRMKLERDELQAVIAHEIAHIRHLDIRFAMLMATLVGLIAVVCDGMLHASMRGGFRVAASSRDKAGGQILVLALVAVAAVLAPIAARLIQMSYSRQREFLADAGAVELTRNPLGLASALMKIRDDKDPYVDTANRGVAHMFFSNPLERTRKKKIRKNWMSSHPPIDERIARVLALTR